MHCLPINHKNSQQSNENRVQEVNKKLVPNYFISVKFSIEIEALLHIHLGIIRILLLQMFLNIIQIHKLQRTNSIIHNGLVLFSYTHTPHFSMLTVISIFRLCTGLWFCQWYRYVENI